MFSQSIKSRFQDAPLADTGLPNPQPVSWPKFRDKASYLRLHFPKLFSSRNDNNLMLSLAHLPAQHVMVDMGCGEGVALSQFKTNANTTIGFTMEPVDDQYREDIDVLCYTAMPDGAVARMALDKLRHQVHILFDTFGPATYANNPIHVLVFYGLLLCEEAMASVIISSILHEDIDQSPIGFVETRAHLVRIFKELLHLDVVIARTMIDSAVEPGAICSDYYVNIKRPPAAPACSKPLDDLFALIDNILGRSVPIPKQGNFGNFNNKTKIQGRLYSHENEPSMLAYDWKSQLLAIHADTRQMHLQFVNHQSCAVFAAQFREFYIAPPMSEWQITYYSYPAITISFGSLAIAKAIEQLHATLAIPGINAMDVAILKNERPVSVYQANSLAPLSMFKLDAGKVESVAVQSLNSGFLK